MKHFSLFVIVIVVIGGLTWLMLSETRVPPRGQESPAVSSIGPLTGAVSSSLRFGTKEGEGNITAVSWQDRNLGQIVTEYAHSVYVFKETENNIYIGVGPNRLDGYILYRGPESLFQVSKETGQLEKFVRYPGGWISDISTDEKAVLSVSPGPRDASKDRRAPASSIGIDYQDDRPDKVVSVPDTYSQVKPVFSPDGKIIVYTAAIGNPDAEAGALFVHDPATGRNRLLDRVSGAYYVINDWVNDRTVQVSVGDQIPRQYTIQLPL